MRKTSTISESISFPSPCVPAWEDGWGHARWTTSSPPPANTVKQADSSTGQSKTLGSFTETESTRESASLTASLPVFGVPAVGLGSLGSRGAWLGWPPCSWLLVFLQKWGEAEGQGWNELPALISSFELELCKSHQHEQLSCECALGSCPYIYGCVNTRGSPTLMGVMFVANRTPQPFSTDKHRWGHLDLPEQPQTWQLLPWAGRWRVGV